MNRIFKSIWNERSGTWVAAPESAGCGCGAGRARSAAVALLLVAGLPLAAHAQLSLGVGGLLGGVGSVSIGATLLSPASASGTNAIAVGANVTASGADAIALSRNSTAAASASVAVGFGSLVSATGTSGVAIGNGASVSGAGSIAIGSGSSDGGLANVLSVGTSGATRRIINVSDGTIALGSHDVVTGGQLYVTHQGQLTLGASLTAALGGGAAYSLTNGLTLPSYLIQGQAQAGIGNAFAAVDTALSTNTTDLANLNLRLNLGTVGLVQQAADANQTITVGASTGGTVVNIAGTAGARQLTGVAAGALSAGSTQAVNGGQLFATNQQVAANTADIAGNSAAITVNTNNINSLTQQLNAGGTGMVRQASAGQALTVGAATDGLAVDFTGTAGVRRLTGIADGNLSAGSAQAVTGGQLFTTNQQVAANTADIAANTASIANNSAAITVNSNDIASLTQQINNGTTGLVRQSGVGQSITVGASTGGLTVDFTGTSGARQLTGVAAGTVSAGSTQAVNGAQLYATNQQVSTNTAQIATHTADIAALNAAVIGAGGGATQSDNTAGGNVAMASGANSSSMGYGSSATGQGSVAIGNGSTSTGTNSVALGTGSTDGGEANVVSVGSNSQKRRIVQVADGVNDSDAATVGQVRSVGDQVSSLSASAVKYDVNPDMSVNTTSVTFGTVGAPVALRNVAAGSAPTDAINAGQLQQALSYIGGGMQVNAGGVISAPSFTLSQIGSDGTVSTANFTSVAAALDSLSNSVNYLGSSMGQHAARINTLAASGNSGTTSVTNITNVMENDMYMHVNSTSNDSVAAGEDSMAFGPMAQALGDKSVAMGHAAQAQAASSVAIGDAAVATGGKAVSIGAANIANGNGAVAIGDPNVATGTGAVAVGADNTATGNGAVAQGNLSVALGDGSVALGNQSLARGAGSIAMGNAATVSIAATNGIALGSGASVTTASGVAIGSGSVASRAGMNGATEAISGTAVASTQAAVSVGSAGNERQITNVAGGTEDTDAVNLRQLRAVQASAVEAATQNVDAKINSLAQGIQRVEKNANSGTAAAMAMAGMPQSAVPGKGMVSAGAATYGGETAIAVGVSMVSDSGKWVSKLNGSANSRGKFGMSVGVGFQW